jgi:hypothetical protein
MFQLLLPHKVLMVMSTHQPIEPEAAEELVKLEFHQVVSVEMEHQVI